MNEQQLQELREWVEHGTSNIVVSPAQLRRDCGEILAALDEANARADARKCEGCDDMETNARRFHAEKVAAEARADALAEALACVIRHPSDLLTMDAAREALSWYTEQTGGGRGKHPDGSEMTLDD